MLLLFACQKPSVLPEPSPIFDLGQVPRNLIVISLDTTRRDEIGFFGGADTTTPFFDSLLAESVVLQNHRSCANWTFPSVMCIQSGQHPLYQGFWPELENGKTLRTQDLHMLPEDLQAAGFSTGLTTANIYFSDRVEMTAGFDRVVREDFHRANAVNAAALDMAKEFVDADAPFYLHIHAYDPHQSYAPPEEYQQGLEDLPEVGFDVRDEQALTEANTTRWDKETDAWRQAVIDRVQLVYRGELRFWDDRLAELWVDLQEMGVLDDTLVLFWTDHGEQRRERGVFSHGSELFVEETSAMAAFWSRDLQPGEWDGLTTHQDLMVTALTLLGIDVPDVDGVMVGEAPDDRIVTLFNTYSFAQPPKLAAVQGQRQLFYWWRGYQAYYEEDDPQQLIDAYQTTEDDLEAMWQALAPAMSMAQSIWPEIGEPKNVP